MGGGGQGHRNAFADGFLPTNPTPYFLKVYQLEILSRRGGLSVNVQFSLMCEGHVVVGSNLG
jgi:hypothetical protein